MKYMKALFFLAGRPFLFFAKCYVVQREYIKLSINRSFTRPLMWTNYDLNFSVDKFHFFIFQKQTFFI